MKSLLVLVSFLFLTGCATEGGLLKGTGMETFPPAQWQILCYEKPELEICKPEVKP